MSGVTKTKFIHGEMHAIKFTHDLLIPINLKYKNLHRKVHV